MAIDPQNRAQIRDRELRVWDQLLRGLDGVEIARREGVDPAVISRIKKRVEQRIAAETEEKAAILRARQIAQIRRARREAWRGWDASCQPAAKSVRRSGARGAGTVEANEIKGQSGNPAFLEKILDAVRLEARLTGTEAPQQHRVDGELSLQSFAAKIQAARLRVAADKKAREGH